jgi:hypothetical protein
MLDAFHPVPHPGGKERTLAFRFARFKDSAEPGCASCVSLLRSVGQPNSPETMKGTPSPKSLRGLRVSYLFWGVWGESFLYDPTAETFLFHDFPLTLRLTVA